MPIRKNRQINLGEQFASRDNTRTRFVPERGFISDVDHDNRPSDLDITDNPMGWMPVVGDILQAGQAAMDFGNKKYGKAALNAGLLLLPNVVEKPVKNLLKGMHVSSAPYKGRNFMIHGTEYLDDVLRGETRAMSPSYAIGRIDELGTPGAISPFYNRHYFLGDKNMLENGLLFNGDAMTPDVMEVWFGSGYVPSSERAKVAEDLWQETLKRNGASKLVIKPEALETLRTPSNIPYFEFKNHGLVPLEQSKHALFPVPQTKKELEIENAFRDMGLGITRYDNEVDKIAKLKQIYSMHPEWLRKDGGLISRLQKHYGSNEKALEAVRKFAGGGGVNAMYDPNGVMWSQQPPTELPEAMVRGPYDWDAMKLRQYWGESRFRDNLTSPAGAKGAFQIMPITQKDYILRGGIEGDLMDRAYNEGVRDDLVALLRGDPYFDEANTSPESFAAMVTGAYNIGRSGFKKRLKELENQGYDIRHSTDWVDAFPVKETRNYMKWVGLGQDVGGDLTSEAFNAAVEKNGFKSGGRIYIKPENRGKFTALKKRTGHSASWFKAHGTPAQKKMATFALNARKWKHGDGGIIDRLYNHSGGDIGKMLELIQKARSV